MTSSPPVIATKEEKEAADQQVIDSIGTQYEYGWHDSDAAGQSARRGLDEGVVRFISA